MGEEPDKKENGNFFQQLPTFWKCQLVGWSLLIPYAFLTRVAFWKDYRLALELTVFLEPMGFLLSLGLRSLYLKIGLKRSEVVKTMIIATLASFIAAIIELLVSEWILALRSDQAGDNRVVRFAFFWMVFQFWSFGYFWLKSEIGARRERKRLQELESSAQRAELSMLRLQMNPHFLFNSLHNIAEEIIDDPVAAVDMTRQLGKFLRYTLERQNDRVVTLSDEIEAMRSYLAIEEKRFRNRLSTQIVLEPGVEEVKLPCFLLQPLVENAVKHGVMSCSPPWKLSVDVDRDGSMLRLRVSNIGTLLRDWETRRRGTGISNLLKRLALHYPGRHRFRIYQDQEKVVAELILDGAAVDV